MASRCLPRDEPMPCEGYGAVTYSQIALGACIFLATRNDSANRLGYRVLSSCSGEGAVLSKQLLFGVGGSNRERSGGSSFALLVCVSLEFDGHDGRSQGQQRTCSRGQGATEV